MTSKAFKRACKNAVYTYVKEHYDAELTKDFKQSDIHVDSFTTHKIPTSDFSDYFTATLSTKLDYKLYIFNYNSQVGYLYLRVYESIKSQKFKLLY